MNEVPASVEHLLEELKNTENPWHIRENYRYSLERIIHKCKETIKLYQQGKYK